MHDLENPLPLFARTDVMRALARHGGSLRIGPLQKASGLSVDDLCAVLNELAQRRWLKIAWRHTPRRGLPERLARASLASPPHASAARA